MSTKSSNQSAGYERVRHSTDNASSDTLLDREEDQTATWKELRASQGLDFRERQNKTRRHLLLIVCLVQTVLLLVLASLCVHLWLKRGEPRIVIQHDVDVGCGAFPLGTDPSGFVPANIGYPLEWRRYDESMDYFLSPDTFDTWENFEESAARLREVHQDAWVHTNGQRATYMSYNSTREPLRPDLQQYDLELYGIMAFHQMHCVYVIHDEIGRWRLNRTSQWTSDHLSHCLNTLADVVTCHADSRPFAFVGFNDHTSDGQQNWCRNWDAMREWVNDPVRDMNFHFELIDGHDDFKPIWRNGTWPGEHKPEIPID